MGISKEKFSHPRYLHSRQISSVKQAMCTKEVSPAYNLEELVSKKGDTSLYEASIDMRMHPIYTEIENFSTFELSNSIAYEMALRNEQVKVLLNQAEDHSRRGDNHTTIKEYYLHLDDVLHFEATGLIFRSEEEKNTLNINSIIPQYSRPILDATLCGISSSVLNLQINFGVDKSQVLDLFTELTNQYLKYIERHKKFWGTEEIQNKLWETQPKVLSTIDKVKKIDREAALLLSKIQLPNNLLQISIANMFFAYDMKTKFNASYRLISDTIKLYHVDILQTYNQEIDKDTLDIMVARPDPYKTVKKWVKNMSGFVEEGNYKHLINSL